ncbi:hypothetical protein BJV77DRAFT_89220 [Russula vinacea]|nr:hypothetical protein BJV77DRAFT_89220 [Russula vinacea]
MDPNYLLQLDYREHHHNDHSGYRHAYPSSFSSETLNSGHIPPTLPNNPTPTTRGTPPNATPIRQTPRVLSYATRALCRQMTSRPPTPARHFRHRCMHPQITSAEPWGPPHNEAVVPFDEQVTLAPSSLAQANPYYPVPVPTPPWIHPSPPSDVTPPTSNSPSSTLANYAGVLPSPSPAAESCQTPLS